MHNWDSILSVCRSGFFCLLILYASGCSKQQTTDDPIAEDSQAIVTETGIEMVLIPGGTFMMGDPNGEADEQPVREVTISPFTMDRFEVTQEDFESLMGQNPSKSKGADKPVEQLSWFAAVKYCNMRSLREGLEPCYQLEPFQCNYEANGYRLPTEAEWEYACRAGSATVYSYGDDPRKLSKYAWFEDNANNMTHPVGQKAPNAWGLYDMHGNVLEWCNDSYEDAYADKSPVVDPHGPENGEECVLRGGGFVSGAEYCRSAARYSEPPGLADVCFGYDAYGFRCVRRARVPR